MARHFLMVAYFFDEGAAAEGEELGSIAGGNLVLKFRAGDARCAPFEGEKGAAVLGADPHQKLSCLGKIALPYAETMSLGPPQGFLYQKFSFDLPSHTYHPPQSPLFRRRIFFIISFFVKFFRENLLVFYEVPLLAKRWRKAAFSAGDYLPRRVFPGIFSRDF